MKKHVFISYSRKNLDFADDLTQHLDEIFMPYWIDRHGISNADRSFEKKIREAIKAAWGAILIASPDALESDFVQGEIDIIRERQIPLIVLWVDGEYFTDTVPTSLTRQSYINCKGDAQEKGLHSLLPALQKMWDKIPCFQPFEGNIKLYNGEFILFLPDKTKVLTHQNRFETIEDFFVKLYKSYLRDIFPPYSYSKKWIIETEVGLGSFSVSIPFITAESLMDIDHEWRRLSFDDFSLSSTLGYSKVRALTENDVIEIIAHETLPTITGDIDPRLFYNIFQYRRYITGSQKSISHVDQPKIEDMEWHQVADVPKFVLMGYRNDTNEKRIKIIYNPDLS